MATTPDDEAAHRDAARAAGAAARELIGLLVGSTASAAELAEVAAALAPINDRLRPYAVTSRYEGSEGLRVPLTALRDGNTDGTDTDNAGTGAGTDTAERPMFSDRLFEQHPFAGPANPLAPPLELFETDDGPAATVTYDHRHEGMPGKVHGGVLAAAFDLVLGAAAARAAGRPAPTGRLTVRYRIPTPLHVELRYESRIQRVDGRKIIATATVRDGDQVTAEAEGLFISARTEMLPTVGRADV